MPDLYGQWNAWRKKADPTVDQERVDKCPQGLVNEIDYVREFYGSDQTSTQVVVNVLAAGLRDGRKFKRNNINTRYHQVQKEKERERAAEAKKLSLENRQEVS